MAKRVPTSRTARTARLGGLAAGQGARWTAGSLADRLRSEEEADRRSGERALRLADSLVEQLGTMKGAAMKLGQVLSGLDFSGLPESHRDTFKARLAGLRDGVEPRPWKELERLLRDELGEPPARVFAEIDQEAFAAASIGQVHRAVTRDGERVAIKLQYPGIAEAVDADIRNFRVLSPLLQKLAPGLDVGPLYAELAERVREELDYELEADRTRQIQRLTRGHPLYRTPRVFTELSSRRVLVTELVDGMGFRGLQAESQQVRDRAGETIFRFYFGLLDRARLALGDPHPGNMLWDGERMVFLDFGMLRQVPEAYLRAEQQVARAVMAGQAAEVHRLLCELGYLPDPAAVSPAEILDQLQTLGGWYFQSGVQRLNPELLRDLTALSASPSSPYFQQLRQQSLPPTALLIRRMEQLVLMGLCELQSAADWGQATRELLLDEPAAGELGRLDLGFWAGR